MITFRITGFEDLRKKFRGSTAVLDREVKEALGKSILKVEAESKRRTPVDTGLLKSSIGGARGWSWVRGWVASVGTNVKYAFYVHEGHGRHNTGEREFMDKGLKASVDFIDRMLKKATKNLKNYIER